MPPSAEVTSDTDYARGMATSAQPRALFALLYERHAPRLIAFAKSRYGDKADDLCQEVWLRAYRSLIARPNDMPNFIGWLFQIAKNVAIDWSRRPAMSGIEDDVNVVDDFTEAPETRLVASERQRALSTCLEQLPPNFRDVVVACVGGESPIELAARLGVSRANVDQRKHRGLEALKTCLEGRFP